MNQEKKTQILHKKKIFTTPPKERKLLVGVYCYAL